MLTRAVFSKFPGRPWQSRKSPGRILVLPAISLPNRVVDINPTAFKNPWLSPGSDFIIRGQMAGPPKHSVVEQLTADSTKPFPALENNLWVFANQATEEEILVAGEARKMMSGLFLLDPLNIVGDERLPFSRLTGGTTAYYSPQDDLIGFSPALLENKPALFRDSFHECRHRVVGKYKYKPFGIFRLLRNFGRLFSPGELIKIAFKVLRHYRFSEWGSEFDAYFVGGIAEKIYTAPTLSEIKKNHLYQQLLFLSDRTNLRELRESLEPVCCRPKRSPLNILPEPMATPVLLTFQAGLINFLRTKAFTASTAPLAPSLCARLPSKWHFGQEAMRAGSVAGFQQKSGGASAFF